MVTIAVAGQGALHVVGQLPVGMLAALRAAPIYGPAAISGGELVLGCCVQNASEIIESPHSIARVGPWII